jgi:uncharacterized surface protein with fasciclin (FAS1) repeats
MKQSTLIMAIVAILVIGVGAFAFMNMQQKPVTEKNTTPVAVESEEKTMNKTIVDIASENSDFSTLVAAVKAAGLVETLSGEGPYTVFAPTNEAFAKLPAGTVEALLKDKEKLTKILTYHVVSGKVMAKDVVGLTSAKTVEGSDLTVKVENGKVMINNANVTTTDIEASNGVIHVIDTVLLPQ